MENYKKPEIINYQVAWYRRDTDKCFDETWFEVDEIDMVIECMNVEDNSVDYSRAFVHFDNGDEYELKLTKIQEV